MNGRSDGSVIIDINGRSDNFNTALSGAKKAAATAGKAIVASLKAVGKAIGVVSTGVIAVGTKIVNEYANYEQLVGGVETLFGAQGKSLEDYAASVGKTVTEASAEYSKLLAAQETVMKNAENAYKTAGMSANDYMETVTSFSASLIQSLGGDTQKAAEYADMAITDMSDNVSKMGTDMEMIQNAYNGFAKQNFTMLDNLKLGYGGTKEEMERLLADAEKLSGIKYDISSYADIVSAIHVIQTEMKIANATAEEAEKTISGSINTLKAAFDNLLAGLGNAEADVQGLIDNVAVAFDNVVKNISPVVDNIIAALPSAFAKISDAIGELLPGLLTTVTGSASEIILTLAGGIADNIDVIISAATTILETLVSTVQALIPTLKDVAVELVGGLCDFVTNNIGDIVQLGLDIINAVCEGIVEDLPLLIPAAAEIISEIVETLTNTVNIDKVFKTAADIIDALVDGIMDEETLKSVIDVAGDIIEALLEGIVQIPEEIAEIGVHIVDKVVEGILTIDWNDVGEKVAAKFEEVGKKAGEAMANGFRTTGPSVNDIFGDPQTGESSIWNGLELTGLGGSVPALPNFFRADSSDSTGLPYTMRTQGTEIEESMKHCSAGVEESTESIKTFSEAIAEQDHLLAIHQITEEQYYKNLADILTKYEDRSSEEWWKIYDKVDGYNQKIAASNKKAEKELAKTTGQISDDFKSFYENLDLSRAMGDITDDEFIAQLDAKLNSSAEYKTPAYKSYWNKVTSAKEQAANEAAKAEEKAEKERQAKREKLQKEFEQKREQAAKERLKQQQETANAELTQFKSDTDKLTSEYKSKLSELQSERDSFQNKLSENIFKTETVTDSRTGETKTVGGTVNLQKKIAARKELGKYLESLVKKGIPKGMLSELAAMDPSEGLQFAKQLDGMKDDKWQSLVADYNDYEAVNKQIADQVYGPQITALNQQYASDMTALMDTVTDGAASAGAQTVKEFISGVDLASDDAMAQINAKIAEVNDSISEAISDGSMFEKVDTSDVGTSMMNGIAKGIISKSDVLKKAFEKAISNIDIMATLQAAVDLKASGYTPASTSTVTNNTVVNNNTYTTSPTAQNSSSGVTNLTVNLLWKDGTKLAEIVNSANKRIAISTGG